MFRDRVDAGQKLAFRLRLIPIIQEANKDDLLVLSIPRGGVVLGSIIADCLECEHNVLIARKIGFPGQEELAIGAVAENGQPIFDADMIWRYRFSKEVIQQVVGVAQAKIVLYSTLFRDNNPLDVSRRLVVLVDDGVATGETMKAGICWLREQHLKDLIVAVPVCSPDTAAELHPLVNTFVCLYIPEHFRAVGYFYDNFDQVSDAEVIQILRRVDQ